MIGHMTVETDDGLYWPRTYRVAWFGMARCLLVRNPTPDVAAEPYLLETPLAHRVTVTFS